MPRDDERPTDADRLEVLVHLDYKLPELALADLKDSRGGIELLDHVWRRWQDSGLMRRAYRERNS